MTYPSYSLLYVESPRASASFYASLLALEPVQVSDTFALFVLPNGWKLGFWSRHTVEPTPTAAGGGGCELCIVRTSASEIDATFADWKARGIRVLQEPVEMDFGYCFTVADQDGHRLRVFVPTGA